MKIIEGTKTKTILNKNHFFHYFQIGINNGEKKKRMSLRRVSSRKEKEAGMRKSGERDKERMLFIQKKRRKLALMHSD